MSGSDQLLADPVGDLTRDLVRCLADRQRNRGCVDLGNGRRRREALTTQRLPVGRQQTRVIGDDGGSAARVDAKVDQVAVVPSRPLVERLTALRGDLHAEGVDRVVLAGMGGSSLAPEVICHTRSGSAVGGAHPVAVLDTTDPGQVSDALAGDLSRTVLVVSSKSGGTVEKQFVGEGLKPARQRVDDR